MWISDTLYEQLISLQSINYVISGHYRFADFKNLITSNVIGDIRSDAGASVPLKWHIAGVFLRLSKRASQSVQG